jgi:uncharacterized protein
MKPIIVDTNAFLRLLVNDIPSQKKLFEQLLQKAKNEELSIFVPQIIIFEIEYSLRKYYLVPKDKIIEELQVIVAMNFIEIEDRQSFNTALGYYAKEKISFVDCFILARSQIENYKLFTFDKKLKSLSE